MIHAGGRFVAEDEAVVSLLDRGYLHGDGVFATMRGYAGVCFRSEVHLEALERSAARFDLALPLPRGRLRALADEAAVRTGASDAYVRVTLTRGATDGAATLSILARPMDVPSEEDYAHGVSSVIVAPRRIPPACLDGTIKTTSYAVQILARREAASRGASEGIQLALDGTLACGTMSNLFVVTGDDLLTPPLETGCRAGVIRGALLELAPRLGLAPIERSLDRRALAECDEAFFASTRVECLPIAEVDGVRVGRRETPSFSRTHGLREALRDLVRDERPRPASPRAAGP